MKKEVLNSITLGMIAIGLTSMANADWAFASNGHIPSGSLVSGHEANGDKLYICRANYNGGVHPGKVRKELRACNIGWGSKEISVSQYETYVIWKKSQNGQIPSSAIVAGKESSGERLYTCRGDYNGGVHSGKVRRGFEGCNISWGGDEIKVNPYEVLVK